MKLVREEKIWLIVVLIAYAAFAMPGIPEYGNMNQTLIHGSITIIALFLSNYLGMAWIDSRIREIKGSIDEK